MWLSEHPYYLLSMYETTLNIQICLGLLDYFLRGISKLTAASLMNSSVRKVEARRPACCVGIGIRLTVDFTQPSVKCKCLDKTAYFYSNLKTGGLAKELS